MKEVVNNLRKIAHDSLKKCSTESGYVAGVHHFVDLWARDSLFACLGDILGDNAKKTIDTFKKHQRDDGLIPYRVRRSSLGILKYLGRPKLLKDTKADFRSFQSGALVLDGGVTFILVTSIRLLKNRSSKEFKKYEKSLFKAFLYYRNKFNENLIYEGYQAEWADAVMKKGNTAYTNIIYVSALKKYLDLLILFKRKGLDVGNEIENVKNSFVLVKKELYKKLWNGKYFADFFNKKRRDFLTSHPNLLAVLFGLTSKKESESILKHVMNKTVSQLGVKSNYPKYPKRLIPLVNYITNTPDYHNGIFWLQPWILYIGILLKMKKKSLAVVELNKLYLVLNKQGIVFENYEKDWTPVKRLFYKSEGPFAWSSGLLLWVLDSF